MVWIGYTSQLEGGAIGTGHDRELGGHIVHVVRRASAEDVALGIHSYTLVMVSSGGEHDHVARLPVALGNTSINTYQL